MDLFSQDSTPTIRGFAELAEAGNKKGVIDYLRALSQTEFNQEVLVAGFSMIGFHHGKSKVIEHVVNQMN